MASKIEHSNTASHAPSIGRDTTSAGQSVSIDKPVDPLLFAPVPMIARGIDDKLVREFLEGQNKMPSTSDKQPKGVPTTTSTPLRHRRAPRRRLMDTDAVPDLPSPTDQVWLGLYSPEKCSFSGSEEDRPEHPSSTTHKWLSDEALRPENGIIQEEPRDSALETDNETPSQIQAPEESETELIVISDDEEEEKTAMSKYPCLVEGCPEGFDRLQDRAYHARLREFDADQLHLAAYFFCKVGSCKHVVPVFKHGRKGTTQTKTALANHLKSAHRALTHTQSSAEKHLSILRTWSARKQNNLKPIMPGTRHLALNAERADLLPPLPRQD